MKTVLWSIFLIVGSMLLTVQCVAGSNSISSFSVKSRNTKSSSWDEDANIRPGQDVRLECTIGEVSQLNEFYIKRADGHPLSIYNARDIQRDAQSQLLVAILRSIECSQMGTYVCENGQGERETVDFGIYDCPPQPCKDQSTDITLYASVKKPTEFSVCVEAFPNVYSFEVRFDRTNEILPGANCTKSKSYQISCQIKFGDEIHYGVHDFSISSSAARNQKVSFALQIQKPERPECPTGIISTSHDNDSVTLLWQPVNNRGGSQPVTYTIFYTINDTEWRRFFTGQSTQATINNLQADTLYEFRVASANEYIQVVDQNTCHNTIEIKTEKEATTPFSRLTTEDDNSTDPSDALPTLTIVVAVILSVVAVVVVVIVVLRFFFCSGFKRHNSHPLTGTSSQNDRLHIPETTKSVLIVMEGKQSLIPES